MNDASIRLTYHGHKQYCDRVGPIERSLLQDQCQKLYDEGEYEFRTKGLIQLGGVWWIRRKKRDGRLFLITCYGKSDLNMPEALIWAKTHNDRINLKHTL